ncbi:hydroxymethylpyrimidine pyrophosphatase-like HAD family hydrolase [Algoriphagus sp. 4150]|uniref:BT0820 family HAD-type phosphatase n=1 Tax=Algoriphagus sp. 4150 TaxID=2817756 RepID=UPI00285EE53C|nr:hydrolase [Algoriphagus sp. 4150]MDR7131902.1 hydroxymethylpyrimidine pyrophosphatase-like HAD family hydrolase [Algoriphagus sp. 4150]
MDGKIIAVDFDGTIVEHAYPEIGKEMLFAFATLKALQQKGHRLILWTYRRGTLLEKAVAFCKKNGVSFYAINENYWGETLDGDFSRKINADIFIDDRNVGGFLGWDTIWQILHADGKDYAHQLQNPEAHQNIRRRSKKTFWSKLY